MLKVPQQLIKQAKAQSRSVDTSDMRSFISDLSDFINKHMYDGGRHPEYPAELKYVNHDDKDYIYARYSNDEQKRVNIKGLSKMQIMTVLLPELDKKKHLSREDQAHFSQYGDGWDLSQL